ncbi:MAG: hypothetical protein R3C56_34100 [Pirellulaceae bacterium]
MCSRCANRWAQRRTRIINAAALFLTFGPAAERAKAGHSMRSVYKGDAQVQVAAVDERIIVEYSAAGARYRNRWRLQLQIQDRSGAGLDALGQIAFDITMTR